MSPVMSLKNVASRMAWHVHADDLRLAAPLAAYLFVVMTSTVIGKAVRDGLFLSHFTALQMTYADLQTVIAIAVTMSLFFRLQRTLKLERLLMASSVVFVAADFACWWAATFHQPWLTRAIYLCVGTQAALMPPQVSILARQVLTTRQAKRLFGVIGCGAIFGWIVGGLVTRAAAGRTGAEPLLLVMGGLSAVCPMLILGIGRISKVTAPTLALDDPSSPGLLRSATLVWSSSHLRTVAALVFLSSVVATISGLQFRAIASQSIGSTDQLTAFFGSFSFHAGLLSLAIQILLTSRVLRSLGVGMTLVIAPVAIATGSVGVLLWGTLSMAVFLKASDHVLRHSIDRAALELLYVPLSASEALQAKTFIEAVVYRLGDGAGALAVIFGASILHMSFPCLSVISLALLGAWIAVALQAQHGYLDHLLAAVRRSCLISGTARPSTRTVRRCASPATWPNGLCSGYNDEELTAWDNATTASLRQTLQDASLPLDVRRRIAHVLSHRPSLDAGRALADSVLEPDRTLRLEILRALTAWHECHPGDSAGREPVGTALAAEIVGLYCLCQTRGSNRAETAAARESEEALERILRLLNLTSPTRDLASTFAALQSTDARLRANALEYLENILEPHYRKLLVPLLEPGDVGRSCPAQEAAGEIRQLPPASLGVIERFLRRG
jgi:ATP/ADP translocase